MELSPEEAQSPLGAVDKALQVLLYLHRERQDCGVTAIGKALGLPKSTTHRLLTALGRRDFVERDERGRYRPGVALLSLGLGVLEQEPVVAVAAPVLERLAQDSGETVFLAALRANSLIVLDKCEGKGFLRASPRIGAELPLHATAIGKLFLALAPEACPERDHASYTEHTLTNESLLQSSLDVISDRQWAAQSGEWIPGLSGVAAPVWVRGRLLAALAISGPSSHLDGESRNLFVALARSGADEIALRLGGSTQ